MKKEIYITSEGFLKIEEELDYLKNVRRAEVSEDIKVARSYGDLSENFEYSAARDEQAALEARIKELEFTFENAIIIKEEKNGIVNLGSKILVKFIEDNDEDEFVIVGSAGEADPFNNKISNESPIGEAVMGHKKGDKVLVTSPSGNYNLEILDVK
ncbi:MAG: transcription elongation factor GreA [Bacilli bacterium]